MVRLGYDILLSVRKYISNKFEYYLISLSLNLQCQEIGINDYKIYATSNYALFWAHNKYGNTIWSQQLSRELARNGLLASLKLAKSKSCPWDEYTCSRAAFGGHLEILKWLRNLGCLWNQMNNQKLQSFYFYQHDDKCDHRLT